jgi:integrase
MSGSLQIKNNMYYIVLNITDDGKHKQRWISTGLKTRGDKRKAEAFMHKVITEYGTGGDAYDTEGILFVDYVQKWLKVHKTQVDTVTWVGYSSIVQVHILPYFEPLRLCIQDVTRKHIQNYYDDKFTNGRCDGKGGLSAKSVKEHGLVINMVFKNAVEDELIQMNPASFAKSPAQDKSFKGKFYNVEQVGRLLEACKGDTIYPIVYLTVVYGLRRSEVMGLKWDAADFGSNMLSIKRTVVMAGSIVEKDKTKNHSSFRSYPLTEKVRSILLERREVQERQRRILGKDFTENGYVFTWQDGRMIRPDYVSHKFHKIVDGAGLPVIRFHDLRHTTASVMLAKKWTLKDIQEWLGHSDITVTANTYTHIDISRKRDIAKGLAGTF